MGRLPWLIGVLFSLMLLPASAGRLSDFRLEAESTKSAGQTTTTKPVAPSPAARSAGQTEASPRPRVDFERQIRPILDKKCSECHSAEKRKGGLSLATYGDALDGGRNGAAIRPGTSTRSIIVQRLLGRIEPQMPKDEDPLPPSEITLIRRWIDEGARETPSSPPAPPPWEAPLGLTRPAVPPVTWTAWSVPIDRFVASGMSKRSATEPSLVGDALFARRAYLDLWGLLPPPDALQAFLKDEAPTSATVSSRRCSPTISATPSTGSRSGTICSATKTVSRTTPRRRAARPSPPGCARRSNRTFPTTASSRSCSARPARRSGWVPRRGELAGRNERRGHAVDAGVAELGADLSRRQPEVQRVSRQLRQPLEVEGRVFARQLLLARSEAAAVPMRPRARPICRARLSLS